MKRSALLVSGLLAVPAVAAQTFMPSIVQDLLKYIFVDVSGYIGTGNDIAVTVARFVIWIAAFSLIYFGIGQTKLKEMRGVHITLSVVISLMATLLIPYNVLAAVWQAYSNIFGILLVLAPAIVTALQWKNFPDAEGPRRFIGGILLFTLGYVYSTLGYSLTKAGQVWATTGDWALLGGTISFLGGAILLALGMFQGKVGGGVGSLKGTFGIGDQAQQIAQQQANLAAMGNLLAGNVQQAAPIIQQTMTNITAQFNNAQGARNAINQILQIVQAAAGNISLLAQYQPQLQTAVSSLRQVQQNVLAATQAVRAEHTRLGQVHQQFSTMMQNLTQTLTNAIAANAGNPGLQGRLQGALNLLTSAWQHANNTFTTVLGSLGTSLPDIDNKIRDAFTEASNGINNITNQTVAVASLQAADRNLDAVEKSETTIEEQLNQLEHARVQLEVAVARARNP